MIIDLSYYGLKKLGVHLSEGLRSDVVRWSGSSGARESGGVFYGEGTFKMKKATLLSFPLFSLRFFLSFF